MNLAIKGHPKRGNEVIEILEMLGANRLEYKDTFVGFYYYIECDVIVSSDECPIDAIVFTLEEFEEKFPYKVGDKVYYQPIPQIYNVCISEIISMKWINDSVVYYTSNGHEVYACDLQPYKEETMEEKEPEPKAPILSNRYDYAEGKCGYVIPDGYEFDSIKQGFQTEIILRPIKSQYPKTYEECAVLLGCDDKIKMRIVGEFTRLINARNAYWKIAGEQMGLGKDWDSRYGCGEWGYWIGYSVIENKIDLQDSRILVNHILVFPTEEMRDAFYENFKDLIEQCKELL